MKEQQQEQQIQTKYYICMYNFLYCNNLLNKKEEEKKIQKNKEKIKYVLFIQKPKEHMHTQHKNFSLLSKMGKSVELNEC